jgi:GntP family gluconate:H+ symporter
LPPNFDPYPLVLLGVGMVTIFVLIIRLRVNAFLALIAAALLVGLLSPRVILQTPEMDAYQKLQAGLGGRLAERNVDKLRQEYRDRAKGVPAEGGSTEQARPRLQLTNAPEMVAQAFGRLMAGIGLSIAFATIIGAALMESGAADRIVRSVTRLFGEGAGGLAMMVSGFVLGVPVFFDTVFLLLVPLAKSLYVRTGRNYLLYVTAIGAGGAITHSLVPPTPGPIGMSERLNVDLGVTIFTGLLVGFPLSLVGLAYAAFIDRAAPVPLRATGATSPEELDERARRPDSDLPSLFVALAPIALPVLLITAATVFAALARTFPGMDVRADDVGGVAVSLGGVLNFLGDKNIALLIAAVVSMILVARRRGMSRAELGRFTARALDDAGMILLITCAGGAFGAMLTAVGVGDSLGTLAEAWGIAPLALGWALAVLFKIAQGSGTVSMITSAGIMAGILAAQVGPGQTVADYLGYHPVYLVMAIGCGSKVGSWMNDSGFWVVCKMSGMTEVETLRSWTVCLVIMGIVGLPFVWALTKVLPLV